MKVIEMSFFVSVKLCPEFESEFEVDGYMDMLLTWGSCLQFGTSRSIFGNFVVMMFDCAFFEQICGRQPIGADKMTSISKTGRRPRRGIYPDDQC